MFDFMKKLEDGVQKANNHNTVVEVNLFLSVLKTAVSVGCNNPELFVKNIKGNYIVFTRFTYIKTLNLILQKSFYLIFSLCRFYQYVLTLNYLVHGLYFLVIILNLFSRKNQFA